MKANQPRANNGTRSDNQRDIFARLFDLSGRQMEALDEDNFERLADLLSRKDEVLSELDQLRRENPSPNALSGDPEQRDLRDMLRKYQAQEKYVMRAIQNKQTQVANRLTGIRKRQSAANGYRSSKTDGRRLNLSG